MDIKEYLNQIQRYEKIINNKLEEIEHLKLLATSISASTYGIERVQTSGSQDKIGDTIAKLVDAQRELADNVVELMEKKQKLIDIIESVKNPQYYDFLYKRYVEGKKLTVIADEMEYNEEYIKQFHGKAVNYVKEMLNFES